VRHRRRTLLPLQYVTVSAGTTDGFRATFPTATLDGHRVLLHHPALRLLNLLRYHFCQLPLPPAFVVPGLYRGASLLYRCVWTPAHDLRVAPGTTACALDHTLRCVTFLTPSHSPASLHPRCLHHTTTPPRVMDKLNTLVAYRCAPPAHYRLLLAYPPLTLYGAHSAPVCTDQFWTTIQTFLVRCHTFSTVLHHLRSG